MKLKYILQRARMFKRRKIYHWYKLIFLKIGQSGLISLKKQRFELIYLRFFKKILRRKHIRRGSFFRKRKFWFFLRPNCILTGKSTNSRMGAGVGAFIRIAINLYPYQSFIEFKYYTTSCLKHIYNILRYRCPIKFLYYSPFITTY